MIILYAFLVGGIICGIGQLLIDKFKLLPIHITSIFVVLGSVLNIGNIYDKLIDIAGAGASIPISSFGHALTHAALEEAQKDGLFGIITGMFNMTSAGITMAIVFAFLASLLFKPKG